MFGEIRPIQEAFRISSGEYSQQSKLRLKAALLSVDSLVPMPHNFYFKYLDFTLA
jgi:hypothetical protein